MVEEYKPPFELTENIANLTIEICQLLKDFQEVSSLSRNPRLRKENRIKSIYSSLSIEQNSLTEDQVTAVINGKRVLAPQKDIIEVQNACKAYDEISWLNPFSIKDLLYIHSVLMKDLAIDAGHFRTKGVGVYKGNKLIHVGAMPEYVPTFIEQLLKWTKNTKLHPLIKSCIFHYEFEYIHPFSDGNGRTGRLWHTLLLSKWEPLLAWLPIESLVYERQAQYYKALASSDSDGKSTKFIEFMLLVIRDVINENVGINVGDDGGIKEKYNKLILEYIKEHPRDTAFKISLSVGLSSRQVERIIAQLKKNGSLQRIGSNKTGMWIVKEK